MAMAEGNVLRVHPEMGPLRRLADGLLRLYLRETRAGSESAVRAAVQEFSSRCLSMLSRLAPTPTAPVAAAADEIVGDPLGDLSTPLDAASLVTPASTNVNKGLPMRDAEDAVVFSGNEAVGASEPLPFERTRAKARGCRRPAAEEDELELWDAWCSLCDQAPHKDEQTVICGGICWRRFHGGKSSCKAVESASRVTRWLREPQHSNGMWVCDDCEFGQHMCFSCHDYGFFLGSCVLDICSDVGRDSRGDPIVAGEKIVIKCAFYDCGKFFHPKCIVAGKPGLVMGKPYICTQHVCGCVDCLKTRKNSNEKNELAMEGSGPDIITCRRCPKAYDRAHLPSDLKTYTDKKVLAGTTPTHKQRIWKNGSNWLMICPKHNAEEKPGCFKKLPLFSWSEKEAGYQMVLDTNRRLFKFLMATTESLRQDGCSAGRRLGGSAESVSVAAVALSGRKRRLRSVDTPAQRQADMPQAAEILKWVHQEEEKDITFVRSSYKRIKAHDQLAYREPPHRALSLALSVQAVQVYTSGAMRERPTGAPDGAVAVADGGKAAPKTGATLLLDKLAPAKHVKKVRKRAEALRAWLGPLVRDIPAPYWGRYSSGALREAVEDLLHLMHPDDVVVDLCFSGSAGRWAPLVRKRCAACGIPVALRCFDTEQDGGTPAVLGVEQVSFLDVRREMFDGVPDLRLVVGLNPPFDFFSNANSRLRMANKFLEKAVALAPRLIQVCVPAETTEPSGYVRLVDRAATAPRAAGRGGGGGDSGAKEWWAAREADVVGVPRFRLYARRSIEMTRMQARENWVRESEFRRFVGVGSVSTGGGGGGGGSGGGSGGSGALSWHSAATRSGAPVAAAGVGTPPPAGALPAGA